LIRAIGEIRGPCRRIDPRNPRLVLEGIDPSNPRLAWKELIREIRVPSGKKDPRNPRPV
jgi:hypothetical protein